MNVKKKEKIDSNFQKDLIPMEDTFNILINFKNVL